eukprot:4607513-Amphidinium_carterae.1
MSPLDHRLMWGVLSIMRQRSFKRFSLSMVICKTRAKLVDIEDIRSARLTSLCNSVCLSCERQAHKLQT